MPSLCYEKTRYPYFMIRATDTRGCIRLYSAAAPKVSELQPLLSNAYALHDDMSHICIISFSSWGARSQAQKRIWKHSLSHSWPLWLLSLQLSRTRSGDFECNYGIVVC